MVLPPLLPARTMEFTQRKRSRKSQSFKLINEGKGGGGFVPWPGAAPSSASGGSGGYETPGLPLPPAASPSPALLFNSAILRFNSPKPLHAFYLFLLSPRLFISFFFFFNVCFTLLQKQTHTPPFRKVDLLYYFFFPGGSCTK